MKNYLFVLAYLSHREPIPPNCSYSLGFIIRDSQVIPASHPNLTAPHRSHSLPRPRGESHEPLPPASFSNDPQMDPSPGLWLVVEDRSCPLGLHPHCYGYLIHCVQLSVVWKHNVAVFTTRQLDGARGKAVWSRVWPYFAEFGPRVLIW